jgi:hypothetical protein
MLTIKRIVLGLSLLTVAHVSLAAPITLNGDHFTVTYDDAQAGLYGQGFVAGSLDTVYFQPSAFAAFSGGSPASTAASLQLSFSVDPGYTFAGISFTERGDYFLLGQGGVDVAAGVQAVNAATAASSLLNLAPGMPLSQTGSSTAWELSGNLATAGLGMPQTLLVTLDNALFASAAAGSLAFIQKTYVGFQIVTVAQPISVPEPAGWTLLLAGMLAALLAGRLRLGAAGRNDRA